MNQSILSNVTILVIILLISSIVALPNLEGAYFANALSNNISFMSDVSDTKILTGNNESMGIHHASDSTNTTTLTKRISTAEYDQVKNCSADLDRRPTSIEYLTYFNIDNELFRLNTAASPIKDAYQPLIPVLWNTM